MAPLSEVAGATGAGEILVVAAVAAEAATILGGEGGAGEEVEVGAEVGVAVEGEKGEGAGGGVRAGGCRRRRLEWGYMLPLRL